MFTRLSVSIAVVFSALCGTGTASSDNAEPSADLENALHQVVVHNDLADIDFLSKTLGIGFRVSAPVPAPYWFGDDKDLHVRVMATNNPSSMFAQELGFTNEANDRRLRFHFIPRERPNISKWAADWNLKVAESQATDAGGTSMTIQSGVAAGIDIEAFFYMNGSCTVTLIQDKNGREPFSTQIASDLLSPDTLVQQLGALVAAGDLRQYDKTSKILSATLSIDPNSLSNGRWYSGYAKLDTVILGIDPNDFTYRVDESGWVSPPAFFVTPAHLTKRTADLRFTVDVYHVCVTPTDLEAELRRRSIRYALESRDANQLTYSLVGKNKITLWAGRFRKCINKIDLAQITDVEHSFPTPIVFSTDESIDPSTLKLNESALRRVDWVVNSAAAVRLGGIDVDQFKGKSASSLEQAAALHLAHALIQAFADRGVNLDRVKMQTGLDPLKREMDTPYVTVDAYTK